MGALRGFPPLRGVAQKGQWAIRPFGASGGDLPPTTKQLVIIAGISFEPNGKKRNFQLSFRYPARNEEHSTIADDKLKRRSATAT